MKRIANSKALLGITKPTDLAELKTIYRNMIKEWHPDKLQDDPERLAEAEVKSKRIIDAYQFLVSISPETHAANMEEYNRITANSFIEDYQYKGQTLQITFQDGRVYEYLGVPENIYKKMVNSATVARFARRHIFFSYIYRQVSKELADKV